MAAGFCNLRESNERVFHIVARRVMGNGIGRRGKTHETKQYQTIGAVFNLMKRSDSLMKRPD